MIWWFKILGGHLSLYEKQRNRIRTENLAFRFSSTPTRTSDFPDVSSETSKFEAGASKAFSSRFGLAGGRADLRSQLLDHEAHLAKAFYLMVYFGASQSLQFKKL